MLMSMQSSSQSSSVCLATPESSQLCLMVEAKIITLSDVVLNVLEEIFKIMPYVGQNKISILHDVEIG